MVFNNEGAELFAYISGWEAPCKLNLVANLPIYMTFRYFLSLFDMATFLAATAAQEVTMSLRMYGFK